MTRAWIVAAGFALGCAGNSQMGNEAGTTAVTGTVAYRERMALPPDAEVHVQLSDISREDVAAPVIADTTFAPAGRQVPLPFELSYDPARIEATHTYAVRATIRSDGRLLFTTTTVAPVLTRGNPEQVALMLVRVPATRPAPAAGSLLGTVWLLEDVGGAGVMDYARATLEFPEAGKVVGRGSCNRFFGSVEIGGGTIAFGPLGSTRMACTEAVMNQENRYLKALEAASTYSLEGPYLFLHTAATRKALRFARETPE